MSGGSSWNLISHAPNGITLSIHGRFRSKERRGWAKAIKAAHHDIVMRERHFLRDPGLDGSKINPGPIHCSPGLPLDDEVGPIGVDRHSPGSGIPPAAVRSGAEPQWLWPAPLGPRRIPPDRHRVRAV